MRPQEYMDLIWDLEQRFAVDAWNVGGVDIWPVVRFQLAGALRKSGEDEPSGEVLQTAPRGLRKLVQAMLAQQRAARVDREHNADSMQRADVLVLCHSAYRSPTGGVFYDRLLDYLREQLTRRGITSLGLEYCPRGAFRTPRALPTRYIQSQLHNANLRNRVSSRFSRIEIDQTEHYRSFAEAIQQTGGAVPGLALRQLARQAGLLSRWAALFTRYLRSSGARLALKTYYYSMEGMALCLAARRLGIPCVDVQHGVQGCYHFAYGPWQCAPAGGYNTLPTVFWCWDAESAQQIGEWAVAQGALAIVGGNPWQALWEGADTPAARREAERIDAALAAQPEHRHILLSLQWDAGLTKGMLKIIKASPADWHWWVRPHPVQAGGREAVRQSLEQCAPGRYELTLAADAPLPLLLAKLDAHVTRSSTVVREAAQAGIRSVVLDPAAQDYYKAEQECGMVVAAESTADAVSTLAGILEQVPPARIPEPQETEARQPEPRTAAAEQSQRALVSTALDTLIKLAGLDAG